MPRRTSLPTLLVLLAACLAPAASAQIAGTAETDDQFGSSFAVGDFNGDGVGDLAIGAPGDAVRSGGVDFDGAGVVNVVYGVAGSRLGDAGNQLLFEQNPGSDDRFGEALAAGDFNDDGFDDLIVGVPGRSVGGEAGAGIVRYYLGSAGGVAPAPGGAFGISQDDAPDAAPESGDGFGAALAAGDLNGDGFDDLAIGVPAEAIGSLSEAGRVDVFYGGAGGLDAHQSWTQDSADISGTAEAGDRFGGSLASGDFNDDGFDDLAVGVPGEGVETTDDAGIVNVILGTSGGLTPAGNRFWTLDDFVGGRAAGDAFGTVVAAGDFNGDGASDLAIGAPGADAGATDAGLLLVLTGSRAGLSAATDGSQDISQDDAPDATPESGDGFAAALAAGDLDGDGFDDLAIGTPGEAIGSISGAGRVDVFYGAAGGLAVHQSWTQDDPDVPGGPEAGDRYGAALAIGDFNGDGFGDLATGAPFEDLGTTVDAGAGNALYGTAAGVNADRATELFQGASLPVSTDVETPSGTLVLSTPYPNPFASRAAVRFELPAAGAVRVAVYDLLGREVALLADGTRAAGPHEVAFEAHALAAGTYLVRLVAEGRTLVGRVTLVR